MGARTSRRGPLTRGEIITAALQLGEQDGLEKLSLHKIAASVGVRTMSLYHHVADKSDVLDAMADQILAEVDMPDVDAVEWERALRDLSNAVRVAAMRYPHSAPLVLVRRLNAPSVLPIVDAALRTLRRAGLEPSAAVHGLRAYIAFLVGSLLREAGLSTATGDMPAGIVASAEGELLSAGLGAVAESAAELMVCDHDAEFDFGLTLLIDALRARIKAGA